MSILYRYPYHYILEVNFRVTASRNLTITYNQHYHILCTIFSILPIRLSLNTPVNRYHHIAIVEMQKTVVVFYQLHRAGFPEQLVAH